ncbi:MAG: hypothetical protein KF900_12145 [Bacteroidetes bacterium]|nr:hypothetical protein [Bacteroidota bacterium]
MKLVFTFLFLMFAYAGNACQCPLTALSAEECNKYDIIFKGKILSVQDCGDKLGEAVFEVEELYKGAVAKEFKVLFNCNQECFQKFNAGEEWIIYSKYKQIDKAIMDWCSRSRKYFKNDKEDFYTVTYGNDYFDEVKFLRQTLGHHRTLANQPNLEANRNQLPNKTQFVVVLICSLAGIILFYRLFNKFFK